MLDVHYFEKDKIPESKGERSADVCVYGGTAAGVIAACTLAAAGREVLLVHPGEELGGMTTGGLSYTDVGNPEIFGGMTRDFYARLGRHYGKELSFVFEPHIASAIIYEMLREKGVEVLYMAYLDRCEMIIGSALSPRIGRIYLLGGKTVTADVFMDCTYEGDLMAAAGVSYTTGRESNRLYGESLNGFQMHEQHQFDIPVDPYVEKGNPRSGRLPGLENAPVLTAEEAEEWRGKGDRLIQAYNFRMCLESNPKNRLPFPRPSGYDPARYELLRRWLEESPRSITIFRHGRELIDKFDLITGTKSDTNNYGAFSTDYIGGNGNWAEAGYEERESIFREHLIYQMGYHYFMQNDPGVPEKYRKLYREWGLPKDEFTRTSHWPHQLYIREGRRMVSDYIITEHNCMSRKVCDDPIAMGAYQMDSHNCQRIIVDGVVRNEGDVQMVLPRPYGISYRSCIPRRGECTNLAVPVALSASHIAFGSVRMEPVFMMLAESMATAVVMSLDRGINLQDLEYSALKVELLRRGQVLETRSENTREGNPIEDFSSALIRE